MIQLKNLERGDQRGLLFPIQDFETGMGFFHITTTPDNTPFNNWTRITAGGFAEGPIIRTPDSVFMGFGFEAIDGGANRAAVMQSVMDYLQPADSTDPHQ